MANEALQFYVDTLIVDAIMSDPRLHKEAQSGIVSSLIQKIYNYAHDKFQSFEGSENKTEQVVNFLIPGVLYAFGFPTLSFISKLAQIFFHIDFSKILEDAAGAIKNLVASGKPTTSDAVDGAVQKVVLDNTPADPASEDDIENRKRALQKASKLTLREAQLYKIALADYVGKNPDVNLGDPEINVKFAAGLFSSSLSTFVASRHKTTKILISVLGWMLKTILAAGGLMAIGDAIHGIVGSGNTGTSSTSPSTTAPEPTSVVNTTTQTAFAVNPSYVAENFNTPYSRWVFEYDPNNIENLLLTWADEIYPGVRGHEDEVRSVSTFHGVANVIKAYNSGGPPNVTFIPRQWKSRKQVVDNFMDEVATKVKTTGPTNNGITPIPNFHPTSNQSPGTAL